MATIFKIEELKPQFNQIVVTRNLYDEQRSSSGLILGKANTIKEYQTVVAIGPRVEGIKPGDVVFINPKRYMMVSHKNGNLDNDKNIIEDEMHAQFAIPTFTVYDQPNGASRQLMLIGDNDVYFVAKGHEFETAPEIAPQEPLIVAPTRLAKGLKS